MKWLFRKESVVWLLLIAFTLVGYFSSGKQPSVSRENSYLILIAAGIKFSLLSYFFMELEEAHLVWKVVMAVLLCVVLLGIGIQL